VSRRELLIALLLVPALALAAACGGGGGGGGPTEPPPPPPQPGITFTPSGSATTGISLARGAGTTADVLELELRADGVQDLYGIAFDLNFPAQVLRFESIAEGPFLGTGGVATSAQGAEAGAGTVVVGVTRLGAVSGASGSGVIATLRFTALAAGEGALSFEDNAAIDPEGATLDLTWRAGTVRVTR
jgi:hypothetical protein